jgi:D-glycero-D-manno-heptose 1,7-bisphosphate phosphatase
MRPAAFLDRDGVICEYVDSLHRVEDFRLRPDVGTAIQLLNKAQYWVFVITNQPMIGKGILTMDGLAIIHEKMVSLLQAQHAYLDSIQFCPHSPGGKVAPWNNDCLCRKPKTGMIDRLCEDFSVDLSQSILVGDTWRDVQCGQAKKLFSYGVQGGAGFPYSENSPHAETKADMTVPSLLAAVQHRLRIT